ncbi:MAG: thiamine-phosphate kinase [Desulfobacteraceae bacterium 4572_87]|nr:MAG: thiamine-phosphate kinase [Desulfobacteraceae bacterium 4572_87]
MNRTLAQVGEFGLIDRIHEIIRDNGVTLPKNMLGIGDDCAAFQPRPGYDLLATCDCMVENRHYLPQFISPHDMGRRAMVLNISDVGAMGGKPRYALISLGLRSETLLEDVLAIYRGFLMELNPFQSFIIGGNVTKSTGDNFIDITLIGEVEAGKIVRRSTAKPGDVILVTGYPGQSAAGLEILLQAKAVKSWGDTPLITAYQCPAHRALEGHAVAGTGLANAMIDTSDGLLGDLGHICDESGVGAELHEENLPISRALRQYAEASGTEPLDYVLKESDDYELMITCDPEHAAHIRNTVTGINHIPVTEIGTITANKGGINIVGLKPYDAQGSKTIDP